MTARPESAPAESPSDRDADPGAGLATVVPAGHRRVPAPDRLAWGRHLRAAYEGGATIRALAADTGWSYGFVHGVLLGAGAQLRPRGGVYPSGPTGRH